MTKLKFIKKDGKLKINDKLLGTIIIVVSVVIGVFLSCYVFINIESNKVNNIIKSDVIAVRNIDNGVTDQEIKNLGPPKKNRSPFEFTSELHEQGFLYEYAQTSIENDFASFGENILIDYEPFWKAVKEYPKLKAKLDIVRDFYIDIDKGYEPILRDQYKKHNLEW